MCRNISNMLLVLFAVVLGLSESQGGVAENNSLDCYLAVQPVRDILCELYGYSKSESGSLDYVTCELECGDRNVPLPKEACSTGSEPSGCTKELAETLTRWNAKMTNRKNDLVNKWCTSAKQG